MTASSSPPAAPAPTASTPVASAPVVSAPVAADPGTLQPGAFQPGCAQPPPTQPGVWRCYVVLSALALGVFLLIALAYQGGRAVDLPAVAENHLPCVSYAPFRRPGHSPFDPALRVTPAMIEADLRILREVTHCVRTYGVDRGLDALPAIARQLGMRVILGAWIDSDRANNALQLERALTLTHEFPDVIDLLVVGNEVLLRGEQSPADLADLLATARQASRVAVSYADVWEFWQRHGPLLRQNVDVVTIHLLPYWEDKPLGIDQALAHVLAVNAEMRATFSPLPVLIGETGWPAAGRQRGAALPGRLEQTQFIRQLLDAANSAQLGSQLGSPLSSPPATIPVFNLIEGFDQPWKRQLEGAMGGYWGIFTADGQARVTLSGPSVADPLWWQTPLAGLFGAIGGSLWGRAGRRRGLSIGGLALAGAGIAQLGLMQWQLLLQWNRQPLDWLLSAALSLAALLYSVQAGTRLGHWLNGQAPNYCQNPRPTHPLLSLLTGLLLGLILLSALGLLLDGRYRPLTWPLLAAPTALLLALRLLGEAATTRGVERSLALLCACAAPALMWQEGLANSQALWLALNWLLLAGAVGWPFHRVRPAS